MADLVPPLYELQNTECKWLFVVCVLPVKLLNMDLAVFMTATCHHLYSHNTET
jgi:hypothetical protein